jgi:hypothetical protein
MKHEQIDKRARVWVVTLGDDGRLTEQVDPELLARLNSASSPKEVDEAIGKEIGRTRTW